MNFIPIIFLKPNYSIIEINYIYIYIYIISAGLNAADFLDVCSWLVQGIYSCSKMKQNVIFDKGACDDFSTVFRIELKGFLDELGIL